MMSIFITLSACHAADSTTMERATVQLMPPVGTTGTALAPLNVQVEIAANDAQREQGLMFRRSMAPDAGMLFVWPAAAVEKFWMRNTYLPLDMLFFNQGQLVDVVAWARPMDESPLGPDVPVDMVLEVNAGWAAAHKVAAGWRLRKE